jgi:hypothetical protein
VSIPRSGWQINHQIIQFAPSHIRKKLLNGLVHHRPAPDNRSFLLDQKADAHHLHSMLAHGHQLAILGAGDLVRAQHNGHTRTIHVQIQNAYIGTKAAQSQS